MLVDRLAGDQQMHDLAGPLEDAVDPQVTDHLLDGHRLLAAVLQRLGRLVAAATDDLHQVVGDPARNLRAVELADGRLDADVVALVVGDPAGDVDHRLETVCRRRDVGDLLRDGVVLADRLAPLDPLGAELARHLGRPLARATQIAGTARRPVLSVVRAIFRPRPSRPMTFSFGTNTFSNLVSEFSMPRRPMN